MKLSHFGIAIALGVLMLANPSAFAQEQGPEYKKHRDLIETELSELASRYLRIPDGVRSGDIAQWCESVIHILRDARDRAVDESAAGHFDKSVDYLKDGLYEAFQTLNMSYFRKSLTARAIWEGLLIVKRIEKEDPGAKNSIVTLNLFLDRYYSHVIDVYENIDIQRFRRDREGRSGRNERRERAGRDDYDNGEGAIEKIMMSRISLAVSQLTFVLDKMTSGDGNGFRYPKGNPNGSTYLSALDIVSLGAADILMTYTDEQAFFACPVSDLLRLHRDIKYNRYPSAVSAVERSYRDGKYIVRELGAGRICW